MSLRLLRWSASSLTIDAATDGATAATHDKLRVRGRFERALERAKEGCAENLRTALGKTNEHLTSLDLSVLSLQKDVAKQASDSAAQLLLLQRLADKLGVIPVLVPPPDLTGPPAPPQARR